MPHRPSFLEQVSENGSKSRCQPMVIPRRVSAVLGEGPTSVTEEAISSSHSSESFLQSDGAGAEAAGAEPAVLAASSAAGGAGLFQGRSNSVASRMRPSLQRMGSSYSRGSFVGKNGSFVSTSLSDDCGSSSYSSHPPATPELIEPPSQVRAVVPSSDSESDAVPGIERADENSDDKETTISSSVPRSSEPINISVPMAKSHSSKYFQESVHEDDYLQQFTPFHNTPTSVSNSYSTHNDRPLKQRAPVPNSEPKLSEVPELIQIATFPTDRLLSMLTALLDKIVKSNDQLNRDRPFDEDQFLASARTEDADNDTRPNIASEILSFRGKHVPAITLQQYFQRIQKYCPTTNDVFLSLLVYFDRIAKTCNHGKEQLFVMDSYNIHRLIISAVTVSTKFFSDFFYSNSRYARVGGISLKELNHLELQFLVLCDFELIISVEELQKYSDLLRDFWNREVGDATEGPTSVL